MTSGTALLGTPRHATSTPVGDVAEAIISILAMQSGLIPLTIKLDVQDPAISLDCMLNHGRSSTLSVVFSNSFGFGGTNAALVFRKFAV